MTSLPSRIQARLSGYYGIDETPAVDDFIEPSDDGREVLTIRDLGDGIEVALRLPRGAVESGFTPSFDALCQIIEGVSHFLYVAERARRELPATQLELELQAEVDKYLLLAHEPAGWGSDPEVEGDSDTSSWRFAPGRAAQVRARLFESAIYMHPAGTEPGDRYRMANDLAARFAGRLEASFASRGRFAQMRSALRRFYAAGQTEKIELARAA